MTKKTFLMTLCCLICTSVIAHTDTENDNTSIVNEVCSDVNIEHESVDLGLPSGLRWATMNVGASSATDYGDYFAWGEVTAKKNIQIRL